MITLLQPFVFTQYKAQMLKLGGVSFRKMPRENELNFMQYYCNKLLCFYCTNNDQDVKLFTVI